MSFANVIARGSGKYELRIEIEGWPLQFCTSAAMAGVLADGRERVVGLRAEGLRYDEHAHLAEAALELSGMSATIVDIGGRATVSFTGLPPVTCWLTDVNMAASDTSINVTSTAQITAGDYLHIGTEAVRVVSVDSSEALTIARAQWGTVARRHYLGTGARLTYPELTSSPLVMRGRRAALYAHTESESATTSTGTLVWRGVVGAEPHVSEGKALRYSITLDPLTRLLEQSVAADIDEPMRLRGIYYPYGAPFWLDLREMPGAGIYSAGTPINAGVVLSGWWEDNAAFCASLQTAIDAAVTAAGFTGLNTISARPTGETWGLVAQIGATARYLSAFGGSQADGVFSGFLLDQTSGRQVLSVATQTTYDMEVNALIEAPRTVPRASYQFGLQLRGRAVVDEANAANAPMDRIYVDRADLVSVDDTVSITIGDRDELVSSAYTFLVTDVQAGYLSLGNALTGTPETVVLPDTHTARVWLTKQYGTGSVADFIASITADYADAIPGAQPLITPADIGDWSDVDAMATSRPLLARRRFVFTRPQRLADVLAEELKLASCYLTIDASWKLSARRIEARVATDIAIAVGNDARPVRDGFGSLAINGDGVLNTLELHTGYDLASDKHAGTTYLVRDVKSISRLAQLYRLKIAPMTASELEEAVTYDTALDICGPVFFLYGGGSAGRYELVTLSVDMRQYSTRIGDSVALTVPQLPFRGTRGIDGEIGVVVGRSWDLQSGRGSLTVLLHPSNIAGYAATARVASQANVSGNTWDLTADPSLYYAAGQTTADNFAAGDAVQVIEWDDSTPTLVTGAVVSVSGNVVRVLFGAAWTPGASVWNLMFQSWAADVARERRYAFCADEARRIDSTHVAQVFAV